MSKLLLWVTLLTLYLSAFVAVHFSSSTTCINSLVVEKVDIKAKSQTDLVYNCSSWVRTPYNLKNEAYLKVLQKRLDPLYVFLNSISNPSHLVSLNFDKNNFKDHLHIIIDETHPLKFEMSYRQLVIGSGLLLSTGHLERGLIKNWFNSIDTKFLSQSPNLLNESVVDLIYFAYSGNFNLQDPVSQLQPRIGFAKWPQVLKNQAAYCESSWKTSEDFELCSALNSDERLNSIQQEKRKLLAMSLRPLLTTSLIRAYENLTLKEKGLFLKNLPELVQKNELPKEKLIATLLSFENPLQEGLNLIKMFNTQFNLQKNHDQSYYRKFVAQFNFYLAEQGVAESFTEAYFDFLIEIPEQLSLNSELFKSLEKAATNHLNLQIAVKDPQQIWILPSRSAVSPQVFDQIKARQQIYFACPLLKFVNMSAFYETAEKLLLIKGCDSNQKLSFEVMFKSGVQEFIKTEKNLAFIQFHIPSLKMRQTELSHVQNFFDLVSSREFEKQELKSLGWQNIEWNKNFSFYKPKASIDAIEFFRVSAPQKN